MMGFSETMVRRSSQPEATREEVLGDTEVGELTTEVGEWLEERKLF